MLSTSAQHTKGEINMRRLVVISKDVISNKRSKGIAALAALVLSLTSIHLAASARIETLKRQQAQLEQTTISAARSLLSHRSLAVTSSPRQNSLVPRPEPQSSALNQTETASKSPSDPVAVARSRQIVISIADRQLAVLDHGQVLKIYPIAVGTAGTPSPDGEFVIINHAKDPTYRHGDKEISPGKDNPLGSRWMGLSLKGYGIHGTNVQSSVGKALSHGCFRMRKADVEELYGMVQVGDTVTIRREHDAMIAQVFDVPATTLAANGTTATAQGGELEMAAASESTTVETNEQ
jgi:lipoprotein-anchoring transpeptidase ErfK/SrfK